MYYNVAPEFSMQMTENRVFGRNVHVYYHVSAAHIDLCCKLALIVIFCCLIREYEEPEIENPEASRM